MKAAPPVDLSDKSVRDLKVLFLDGVHHAGEQRLHELGVENGNVKRFTKDDAPDRARLLELLAWADATVLRSGTNLKNDEAGVEAIEALGGSLVIRGGVGTDNIDSELTAERGIVVANTPFANIPAVKQWVLYSLLWAFENTQDISRRMRPHTTSNRKESQGEWLKQGVRREISEKVFGVLGGGRIGTEVAQMMKLMGLSVIFSDPHPKADIPEVEKVDMETLFRESDAISVHMPLIKDVTENMVGEDQFRWMKKNGVFLHAGRGGVVDEGSLAKALEENRIGRSAVDVFVHEGQNFQSPLQGIPEDKLHLTSHLGGNTPESQERVALDAVEVIRNFFERLEVTNGVNVSPTIKLPGVDAFSAGELHDLFVIHKNKRGAEGEITSLLGEHKLNITQSKLATLGRFGNDLYSGVGVYRFRNPVPDSILESLGTSKHVIRSWLKNYT